MTNMTLDGLSSYLRLWTMIVAYLINLTKPRPFALTLTDQISFTFALLWPYLFQKETLSQRILESILFTCSTPLLSVALTLMLTLMLPLTHLCISTKLITFLLTRWLTGLIASLQWFASEDDLLSMWCRSKQEAHRKKYSQLQPLGTFNLQKAENQ